MSTGEVRLNGMITKRPHIPRFAAGDTIGCGINFTTYTVFFTKNGIYLPQLDCGGS